MGSYVIYLNLQICLNEFKSMPSIDVWISLSFFSDDDETVNVSSIKSTIYFYYI